MTNEINPTTLFDTGFWLGLCLGALIVNAIWNIFEKIRRKSD